MTLPLSGIYKITNLKNGKVYVGQSQNVFKRRDQHFVALRHGTHENKRMQEDGNKDNRGFRGDVIEYCPLKDLNSREKYGIDKLDTIATGYNYDGVPYKRKAKVPSRQKVRHYHKTS